jgi:hypothetical protein
LGCLQGAIDSVISLAHGQEHAFDGDVVADRRIAG